MKYTNRNEKLTIYLEGRVTAANASELEAQIDELLDETGAHALELNAKELEYISSAGLRMVIRLLDRLDDAVSLVDASRDVYDIFEMTGLTQQMTVRRSLRQVSIEGCTMIGKGETARVYRINDEDLIKVYDKRVFTSVEMVEHDFEISKAAFVAGVPTAIPYELVMVGDEYGTIFERLNARELMDIMLSDREHLADWAARFAQEIHKGHQIEVDPSQFEDIRARLVEKLSVLVDRLGTQEEIDTLKRMYTILPERHTFLHADCHPGNMMVGDDGEFFFIDLSSAGCGHPVIDLSSMWIAFKSETLRGREGYEAKRAADPEGFPFSYDETLLIWNTFLKEYLGTDDEAIIAKADAQLAAYSELRHVMVACGRPTGVPQSAMERKQRLLDYCAHIEPVCFD